MQTCKMSIASQAALVEFFDSGVKVFIFLRSLYKCCGLIEGNDGKTREKRVNLNYMCWQRDRKTVSSWQYLHKACVYQ